MEVGHKIKIWDSFKGYVQQPYLSSAYLADIMAWFEALNQRQQNGEDLRLSFVVVKNELTDRKFEAFCLNEQIYFSADPAVLTLPHPPSTKDTPNIVPPDQLVGIWLHAYGPDETRHSRKKSWDEQYKSLRIFSEGSGGVFYTYGRRIYQDINMSLSEALLPGGKANCVETPMQLRVTRGPPSGSEWHRDTDKKDYPDYSEWSRVLISPILGLSTLFALDGNTRVACASDEPQSAICCPLGATSSHLTGVCKGEEHLEMLGWGARHRAQRDTNGRAILVMSSEGYEGGEPIRGVPTPWKMVPLNFE